MSAIRRANPKSVSWKDKLSNLSSDKITETRVVPVDEEMNVDNHPFPDQDILKLEFEFEIETFDGRVKKFPMSLYYRAESGLLILLPGRRDDLLSEVILEIRQALENDLKIHPGISVSKEGIWNFITQGKFHYITIRHEFESYRIEGESDIQEIKAEIGEEVIGNKVVEEAKLVLYNNITQQELNVHFKKDTFSIPSDSYNGPPREEEYPELNQDAIFVIQLFEREAVV